MDNLSKINLVNTSFSFTSQDVFSCNDRDQLKEWLLLLESEIQTVKNQINEAKLKVHTTGEYSDPQWFHSANKYRGAQVLLKKQIEYQIKKLKEQEKKTPNEENLWKYILKQKFPKVYKVVLQEVMMMDFYCMEVSEGKPKCEIQCPFCKKV